MLDQPTFGSEPCNDAGSRTASSRSGCLNNLQYALAGASFIPLIGIFFGLVTVIWGTYNRAWRLVVMGCCGIVLTVILYGGLAYFGFEQRGGLYDRMRSQLTVTLLDDTVRRLEFYKIQHGRYPVNLGELYPENPKIAYGLVDPTSIERSRSSTPYIFYEVDPSGGFYFLRSVGVDGVPFTEDDILPSLNEDQRKNTGLRLTRQ